LLADPTAESYFSFFDSIGPTDKLGAY